jgi:hypothetical protein
LRRFESTQRTRTAEGNSRTKAQGQHRADPGTQPGPAERGRPTLRRGRYARRTGPQLCCRILTVRRVTRAV